MIKVGLTGNIASGKSLVSDFLKKSGYRVFDADICAHKLLENNSDVIAALGTNDRKELADIVFNDKNKLKKLEEILYPLVKDEIIKFFESNKDEKIVFAEVSQLYESGFEGLFDKVIFVSAPYDLRLERLIKRNGYSEDYARLRLDSQISEEEKIPKSDFVIKNDSTAEELKERTFKLFDLLKNNFIS